MPKCDIGIRPQMRLNNFDKELNAICCSVRTRGTDSFRHAITALNSKGACDGAVRSGFTCLAGLMWAAEASIGATERAKQSKVRKVFTLSSCFWPIGP